MLNWTADDWGLSPGVNEGILELVCLGVVRRVSTMANGGFLEHLLPELLQSGAKTGIHFNLSFGRPLGKNYRWLVDPRGDLQEPKKLLALWLTPWIRKNLAREIQLELGLQLERLQSLGIHIQYFDSHNHTHLLPGLMKILKPTLGVHLIHNVRLPLDPGLKGTKQAPVYWLARWNQKSFQKLGFVSLPFFYPGLDELSDPEGLKARAGDHTEVIVHPAKTMDFDELGISDTYRKERLLEFEVLKTFAEPS